MLIYNCPNSVSVANKGKKETTIRKKRGNTHRKLQFTGHFFLESEPNFQIWQVF